MVKWQIIEGCLAILAILIFHCLNVKIMAWKMKN